MFNRDSNGRIPVYQNLPSSPPPESLSNVKCSLVEHCCDAGKKCGSCGRNECIKKSYYQPVGSVDIKC